MNKRIDLSNLGGFPLEQDTLQFMQDSYRGAFSALAKLAGSKVILHGVEVNGSNVSDGWIAYNGELIPFIGGSVAADVVISETPNAVQSTFEDGTIRDVYFTKTATCGISGEFPFSDLERLSALQNVWRPGDIKERYCTAQYITDNFDADGFGINAEKGWRILGKALPQTLGRVMVNYNPADTDFNLVGKIGGEKNVTLTINNIPPHTHTTPHSASTNGGGTGYIGGSNAYQDANNPTGTAGGGTPHNNMPPYYVILKLIKL